MAVQGNEQIDWVWFTYSRVSVLRELADARTEREAAERLGISYHSVRSIAEDLKNKTSLRDVRELGRWWRENREPWAAWVLEQGGLRREGY